MEITVKYGYAASIGSLVVWALIKGESDREGAFDWGQVTVSKYSDRATLLLMSLYTAVSKEYLTNRQIIFSFTDVQNFMKIG